MRNLRAAETVLAIPPASSTLGHAQKSEQGSVIRVVVFVVDEWMGRQETAEGVIFVEFEIPIAEYELHGSVPLGLCICDDMHKKGFSDSVAKRASRRSMTNDFGCRKQRTPERKLLYRS